MRTPDKFILCYVTDRRSLDSEARENPAAALVRRIESAARAGVHWVQVREKDLPGRSLTDLTRAALEAFDNAALRRDFRIVVNDRCDVALAAGAAGVHLGDKSLPIGAIAEARRVFGAEFLIGVSCHSVKAAISAAEGGADYVFFGPIFATPSKAPFGAPQGLVKLRDVCHAISLPVIAIGGITLENARSCSEAGAAGIAAIRLFQQHADLAEIVAALPRK